MDQKTRHQPPLATQPEREDLLVPAREKELPVKKKPRVKKELAVKYDIQTRTISNSFNSQLQSYKLTGGNRNRQIVLKKTQLKTIMARSW